MSLNEVYKKDPDSCSGSVSPGLSQNDEQHHQDSSLVDIFIQNSRPLNNMNPRGNHMGPIVGGAYQIGAQGPSLAPGHSDQLYLQPPSGEISGRNLSRKGDQNSSRNMHRQSGSFAQLQKERAQQIKNEKIGNFMQRQNEYEKRKENNLKKLTKQQLKKERTSDAQSLSINTPRAGNTATKLNNFSGKKASRNSSMSQRRIKNISKLTYDSFEGVKDGVANKMHCDPHSTTSNLALQTISFPGGSNMASMDQQYLNTMNTHPLMQQAHNGNTVHRQASYPMMVQSHQQLGLHPQISSSQQQQYGMGGLTQLPDYYHTTMTNNNNLMAFNQPLQQQQMPQASSNLLLPRPYSVGQHQRQVSGGRPVPPHMAQTQATSQAFGMAGIQEEVLDEFPVPSNVHAAPKQTDMSIEQKSFLQMQNAINNMSLRLDDGSIPGNGGATFDSQNVTGMMMNALSSGPQGELIIGQGPGMSVTPIRHIEGSNPDLLQHFGQNGTHGNNQSSNKQHMMGPSGLGSRVGSNFVSQTNINQQPFNQGQQLETTQIIGRQSNQNGTDRQSMIQKTNSASNFGIVNQNMASSQQQQLAVLQNAFGQQQLNNQMNLNMNMNMIYDNSRGSNGNIAKDIDMLDSEFAQEESRQIEAYYRSVNRESTDQLNNKNSSQNKQSSSLHQPRRSSKRSTRKGINAPLSPPSAKYHKKGGNTNRSMTDRKHKNAGGGQVIPSNSGIKVGVSRLDSHGINVGSHASSRENPNQFGGDTSSHQTVNRSQLSRDSQKSARQVNAKAVAQARNHLLRIQEQKRIAEMQKVLNEQKKKMVSAHHKTMRDELYLSNKLTRQFIMVTSLVMQSEDLSEDSIFNYAQYTEFAIRFGLMSERAASEESDERALLYEMWCTLSRVHSDFAFIRVVNLKTMITAILGFPIAVHRNPANMVPKRSNNKLRSKPQQTAAAAGKGQKQTQRNLQNDQVIEEGLQESDDEDEDDSEFDQADMEDEVPTENNNSAKNELRASHQHLGLGAGAGKEVVTTNRDSTQSFDSQSQQQMMYNNAASAQYQQQRNYHHEKRASSVIDEQDEFRAAENGQLSSPEESQRQKQNHQHQQQYNSNSNNFQENQEEHKYFFDQENNNDNEVQNGDAEQDDEEQDFEDGEGDDDDSDSAQDNAGTISGDTTSQNEYAIDRAHKIGFFVDHFEFCMSRKDVRTVQRRFKLFHKNWREFQKKDLIVKKSVIVDDGATFMPKINKKSEQLMRNKEQGNIEFPFSTRNDMKSQRRQKIWERELPKGCKTKERMHAIDELNDDRGEWLTRTEQSTTAGGLPFCKSVPQNQFQTRESIEAMSNRKHNRQLNDYFALGQNEQHMHTHSSVISRASSQGKNSSTASSQGRRKLTYPQMSQRMEHIYQVGRHKMLNRQDNDQDSQDFEKNEDQCTFKPQISNASKQISMRRSFSKEDKPWLIDPTTLGQQPQTTRNNMSSQQTQQQLAERMQLSIQKDIMRKKIAQREKQIKDKVINHGGWPKDYQNQQAQQATSAASSKQQNLTAARSQENFKPTFKRYDGKGVGQQKNTNTTNNGGGRNGTAMATMRRSIKSKGQQQQQQLSDYPVTTNTSTNLLRQPLSPEMKHQNQQLEINNTHQMQQQIDHEKPAQHQQDQNQDSDGLVTPVNEFTTGRAGAGLGGGQRNLPQTMLLQHLSNANPTPREETPSRGMAMTHMQSLETGGIHHSGDEQGRAPLESQSSVQNVQSTHSASKDQVLATNNSGGGEQDNGLMTNITMTPTSSSHYNAQSNATHQKDHHTNSLVQHAVDQLTVIQETTFEQREKGGLASDFISNDTSAQNRKPLLFIEVDTNGAEEGGIERIEVFKGDDPRKLSIDFCKKHDYDEGTQIVLQRQIEDKLARTYAKLEAKMNEKRQNRLAEKFRERQTQKTNKNAAQ